MDLLGSILGSMDKPPAVSSQEKKRREAEVKRAAEEKKKKSKFRKEIEQKVSEFIQDGSRTRLSFEPMEKVYRSIVHDVADVAGLTSFSFGDEDIDRYIMLFKKEHLPSDEELEALRSGKEYDPSLKVSQAFDAATDLDESPQQQTKRHKSGDDQSVSSHYHDKYKSILGDKSAKGAAVITTPNKAFGYVPSENKKDQRSIEQTLNDIKQRKRQQKQDN
ncbi:sperm-associated antigen 7 homolog [Corticium candelabrum]|uniref:sperm-associated antigen 7 homolog n=1 Tax=Corticium candelabrum TaxID=121492 RepID=UPI002E25FA53|nr:sperm-associated antigen 7 homolog [Corticium candelabrum]